VSTRSSRRGRQHPAPEAAPAEFEDIGARAARLGTTPERVLTEYARIAFADVRHIVQWTADGLEITPSDELTEADAAAISEIVSGTGAGHSRVKFYDKKAALDAIARHLGMFPLPPRHHEAEPSPDEEEDPRDFLARALARLAGGPTARQPDPVADPPAGADDKV
jgi:phage terminase small subunit